MLVIVVLSFQGPEGGLTFPMNGISLHWFHKLAEGLGVVDIGAAMRRSLARGLAVMAFTVVFSVLAGLACPPLWARTLYLDAAIRPADNVCDLQPLQPRLRGGRA